MIENGTKVKIHYTGTLDDGTQFDSSAGRDPLEFEIGANMVIPGFENGVKEMEVGEKKTIKIPPEEAYGEKIDGMIMQFSRSDLPEGITPELGMMLQLQGPQGQAIPAKIVKLTDDEITLDANHPLAGETLHFELELIEADSK